MGNYSVGGVRAPNFAAFIIPVIMAGLILGRQASILLAILTVGVGLAFVYAEHRGWLPPLEQYNTLSILILHSGFIIVSVILLNIAITSIQSALTHLRASEQALAENCRLLQREIEERKRVEQALRVSEEQYRQLFEVNPYPLFVIDAETLEYLAVNDASVDMMGYSHDEFKRMTVKDARLPEDYPQVDERQVHLISEMLEEVLPSVRRGPANCRLAHRA